MLNQLLELLRAGGTHRVADLARELDTTPSLVEAMLEEMSRLGYLKSAHEGCTERCGTCPMAGLCAAGESGRMWTLTDKGAG
jgi:hypothetical protein